MISHYDTPGAGVHAGGVACALCGPQPEQAREIERKMQSAIDGDAAGLAVRFESGELHFSHTAVAFVVERFTARTDRSSA